MGKRKPNGYIAVCQCGVTVGAVDLDRTDRKDSGKIIGHWIAGGYELKPQFGGEWQAMVSACQCEERRDIIMSQAKHPVQPLIKDDLGVVRFKSNKIVEFILKRSRLDMNDLALEDFTNEDREQFAQLIGYSLSGFGGLSYVSTSTYEAAKSQLEQGGF